MKKKLLLINYVAFIFLLIFTGIGAVTVHSTFKKYGFTYNQTTIIEDDVDSREVSIFEGVFSTTIFLLLLILIGLNISYVSGEVDKKSYIRET